MAVQLMGCSLLLVDAACLLEHCVSTLPLALRSAWAEYGICIDFPSMWPLQISVSKEELKHDDDMSQAAAANVRRVERLNQSELVWHVVRHTPLIILQNDWWLLYYLLSILNCALGLTTHPFFFVPALLDVVVRSRLLQKVIEAVTVNKDSLALTFLLVAIVIYQFTIIGTLFFRDDYIWHYETDSGERKVAVDLCATTAECFMNSFYLGLNYGGLAQGLQDIRDKWDYDPYSARIRWFIDLLFYISVIVMLLNIIFGIVIDTFAQQRDLQKQIKEDMENVCFVCGIDRNTFDRKHALGFEHHREHEHNIWNYLNFIIHLRKKSVTDYTGPESYVKQMLEARDLSFFPILKTSSIIFEDVSNEVLLERVEKLSQQLSENTQRIEAIAQS
uniref:Ion transport domain-containing protein n=1 Tax=Haptolina ericina TaxID=156174 RepID=A0A7S3B2S7_9EUKA